MRFLSVYDGFGSHTVGKGGGWLDEGALNECFVLRWLAKEYE